jgi:hypothetical protein
VRAIVRVQTGPQAGQKALIEPGHELRVGRTSRADLVVASDAAMAGSHFALAWDGAVCKVRDLESPGGTELGGERVATGEVENGAFLVAGETTFSVHFEGATPPRVDRRETPERRAARAPKVTRALARLSAEADPLFALLDAARDDRILELLDEAVDEHRSLYTGVAGDALSDVAPYLVTLRRDSALLGRLVEEGWGRSWGVYLTSRRAPRDVRAHLQRFTRVETEDEGPGFLFRFHDPRVLGDFLPTCTPAQRGELFGEIGCFMMESETGDVLRFAAKGGPACS